MNIILRASRRTAIVVGRGWKFIGRSITFNGSNNDFGFLSGGVNLVCFLILPVTLSGVIIFTSVGLPLALTGAVVGTVVEVGAVSAEAIATAHERRLERKLAERIAREEREAPWLRRKPTILTRVFVAQAFQAHGVPKDVTEMFTKNLYGTDKKSEVKDLTSHDYRLFAEHNKEMIDRVYHDPKYAVVIQPGN